MFWHKSSSKYLYISEIQSLKIRGEKIARPADAGLADFQGGTQKIKPCNAMHCFNGALFSFRFYLQAGNAYEKQNPVAFAKGFLFCRGEKLIVFYLHDYQCNMF